MEIISACSYLKDKIGCVCSDCPLQQEEYITDINISEVKDDNKLHDKREG